MSLCDKCYAPGACCKRFKLSCASGQPVTFWTDEPIEDQLRAKGLPFEPVEQLGEWTDPDSGRMYAAFEYNCPLLRLDGRCGDYENRPNLCRQFEPGSDTLCVHYMGAEGTGDGL